METSLVQITKPKVKIQSKISQQDSFFDDLMTDLEALISKSLFENIPLFVYSFQMQSFMLMDLMKKLSFLFYQSHHILIPKKIWAKKIEIRIIEQEDKLGSFKERLLFRIYFEAKHETVMRWCTLLKQKNTKVFFRPSQGFIDWYPLEMVENKQSEKSNEDQARLNSFRMNNHREVEV